MAMNTGKYENGSDVRIYIGGKLVAGQQNCTLDLSSSTIDCSTKESGLYEEFEVAGLGWGLSLDGLIPLEMVFGSKYGAKSEKVRGNFIHAR